MSETIEIIKSRRSVRSFQEKEVPEKLINRIIECACYAPSGMNAQPWRFIVVTNPEVREELRLKSIQYAWPFILKAKKQHPERFEMIKKRFDTLHDPIYYQAPVIIFIIGTGDYSEYSCALAAQNLMLSAASLSLGSCWVAAGGVIQKDDKCRRLLGLKKDEKIIAPIIVGFEEGSTKAPKRKKTNIIWI